MQDGGPGRFTRVDCVRYEKGLLAGPVSDVKTVELEAGMDLELLKPPLLQPNVVGVVQVIEADDLVPFPEKQLAHLGGDESRRAGRQVLGQEASLSHRLHMRRIIREVPRGTGTRMRQTSFLLTPNTCLSWL